jgi:hypothetical protein
MRWVMMTAITLLPCVAIAQGDWVVLEGSQAKQTAANIESRGYHCPKAERLRQQSVNSDGSKTYRISCGANGPDYLTTVYPSGRQELKPVK